MGHLTTRHYAAMFDDAAYQLFAEIGYFPGQAQSEGWGWADIVHELHYRAELRSGDLVRLEGRVVEIGRTSLTLDYRMTNRSTLEVTATLSARTVCFDLVERKAKPIPQEVREKARRLVSPGNRQC